MKKLIALVLAVGLTGCAAIHRHPTATKIALISLGAAGGAAIAIATTHNCPKVYDGKPYDGTPPCPK